MEIKKMKDYKNGNITKNNTKNQTKILELKLNLKTHQKDSKVDLRRQKKESVNFKKGK